MILLLSYLAYSTNANLDSKIYFLQKNLNLSSEKETKLSALTILSSVTQKKHLKRPKNTSVCIIILIRNECIREGKQNSRCFTAA